MAYDPASGKVFAANGLICHDVVVVNASGERLLAPIPLASNTTCEDPLGFAVDDATHRVFFGDWGSGNITVIDEATDSVVTTFDLQCSFRSRVCNLEALVFDAPTGRLFAATYSPYNETAGNLTVLNSTTGARIGSLPISASALLDDPGNGTLYAANTFNGSLAVIRAGTLQIERWWHPGPVWGGQSMALDPATGDVFLSGNYGSPQSGQFGMSVYRGTTLLDSQPFPDPAWFASSVAFDTVNRHLYLGGCCAKNGENLAVVDPTNLGLVGTIPSESSPEVLTIDPKNGSIWADTTFGGLQVFSAEPPSVPHPSVMSAVLGEPNALFALLGIALGGLLVTVGACETWAGRKGGEHRVPGWVRSMERAEEQGQSTRLERTSTWFWIGVLGLAVIALLVLVAR